MSARVVDVAVIGAGPAGLAAARAVAKTGLACVAIDRMGPGGQLMNLGSLHGVPDLPPDAMAPDLVATLTEAAMEAGAELAVDEVERIAHGGNAWLVEGLEEAWTATAVVIASGLAPGTTGLPDEARFEGRGLSHCAHCDAPLYTGRQVVVVGHDRWAITETLELAGHAARVTVVTGDGRDLAPDQVAALAAHPNVEAVAGSVTGLAGAEALEQVTVATTAGERQLEASGLFLQIGRQPARSFLAGASETAEGLYWAGDVSADAARTVPEAIAAGARAGQDAAAWVRDRQGS